MRHDALSDFDREMIRVAVRLHRSRLARCLYLATLLVPLLLFAILTRFKAETFGMVLLVDLLLFGGFFFLLAGVIAKLAPSDATIEPGSHPISIVPMPRWKVSLITYLGILLLGAVVMAIASRDISSSQLAQGIFGFTILIGGGIGFAAMVGSFIIYAANNRPLSNRWMAFGVDLVYWAVILLPVYVLLFMKEWRG